MNPADLLLRLRDHQARILGQIATSVALTDLQAEEARLPLAKARWSMARMLRGYQLFKHTEIFDPAILRGDVQQVATARRMKADCVAAGEDFTAYVARWSAQDVVAVWPEYRPAMRAMSEQLRHHLAREQREAAALLAGPSWGGRSACLPTASADATPSPGRSPPAARADSRAR